MTPVNALTDPTALPGERDAAAIPAVATGAPRRVRRTGGEREATRHGVVVLLAISVLGLGAAAQTTAAAPIAPTSTAPAAHPAAQAGAIPYLTVLPPRAVRRHEAIVRGRIQLRAIIAADGLVTKWSIRIIHRQDATVSYRIIAHGTLSPASTKTVTAVAFGSPRGVVVYDVTAANAAGGNPTPPMRARIA